MNTAEAGLPSSTWNDEMADWYKHRANEVRYTDGSPVREGDQIRYHQAPGGMLPHGDWRYGTAEHLPDKERYCRGFSIDELHLRDSSNGHLYGLAGHVIERAS